MNTVTALLPRISRKSRPTTIWRRSALAALAFAAAFLSSCGGSDDAENADVATATESAVAAFGFTPSDITLRESGELKELLDDSLIFVDASGRQWTAPKGTLTDGASVPRLALPVTDGRWSREFLKAAVVHDAYCQTENENRAPDQYRKRTWRDVHRMFYEATLAGGTSPTLAKIMFAAVWLGGPRWDDPGNDLQAVSADVMTMGYVGTKQWIEENDPNVDEIIANIEAREPVLVSFSNLESSISTALEQGDTRWAESLLQEQERLVNTELGKAPQDLMNQSFSGFLHKNKAQYFIRVNAPERARIEVTTSGAAFQSVLEDEPRVPTVLNGLANVSVIDGDLDNAERLQREALALKPDYEPAQKDLQRIEMMRDRPNP